MSLPRLALIAAVAFGATSALAAGSDHGLAGGPPVISRPGLPLDPELLPANSAPGDCVVRRVTGPGGAYRWDRVECDREGGWTNFDHWGYGRGRLDVEAPPPPPPPRASVDIDSRGRYEIDRHASIGGGAEDGPYVTGGGYVASQLPPPRGDRYGEQRRFGYGYERREETYEHSRERHQEAWSRADYGDRYGPVSPPTWVGYRYAGRDEAGYLVWPDKTP